MGLDITLGIFVLLGALRGWFRGFMTPAIRLAGLVGSAYAAAPIREFARPHVAPYLPTIAPDLLDRMLWWASAVVAFLSVVVVSGVASAIRRRQPAFGEPDANRADQFAGMLFGAAKTGVVLVFVVAGLDTYSQHLARMFPWAVPWVNRQARNSKVLVWHREYQPADRIWTSPPVRQFVSHVHRMGIRSGEAAAAAEAAASPEAAPAEVAAPVAEIPAAQTAAKQPPRLALPEPTSEDFLHAFDRAIETIDRAERKP